MSDVERHVVAPAQSFPVTRQSCTHLRMPIAPKHARFWPQRSSSHDWPASALPRVTQLVTASSRTTEHVSLAAQPLGESRSHDVTGTQTGIVAPFSFA